MYQLIYFTKTLFSLVVYAMFHNNINNHNNNNNNECCDNKHLQFYTTNNNTMKNFWYLWQTFH